MAILRSLESTTLDETIRSAAMQNSELVNLKCVDYAYNLFL